MKKEVIVMIKVYQIQLTYEEIDAINRGEESEKSKAYFDRSFERTFKAESFKHYSHVANVHTDDMDSAFRAMNLWDCWDTWEKTAQVDRLGPCSSMSVGDILELEDGSKYRCASFGFTPLDQY